MSNCNCIEKVVAAIREDKAKYPHAEGVALLNRIADRLSPPPAPAAEPCCRGCEGTGRAMNKECEVETCLQCDGSGKAARAALAAEKGREQAAEPAVEKPSYETQDQRCAWEQIHALLTELGIEWGGYPAMSGLGRAKDFIRSLAAKSAPASAPAFDAKVWAEKMVIPGNFGMVAMRPHTGELGMNLLRTNDAACVNAVIEYWRGYIAAALTAAHAAGDAAGYARGKAEQRAPEGCVINQNSEVLVAEPVHAAPYPFNPRHYTTEWLWRLTKQPADPDAKEAGR